MSKIGKYFTAVVVAKNESVRLPLVLENFSCLENVLIADNHSTDDTRLIAERYGRPWLTVENTGGFCETDAWMSMVWANVKTPYFLLAACAESLPVGLLRLYDKISTEGNYYVVRTQRISITAGVPIPIDFPPRWLGWRYPGEVRFFKIGSMSYKNNEVHGRGKILVPESRVLKLGRHPDEMMYQYRDYDASETERKHLAYNDLLGEQKYLAGESGALCLVLLRAFARFFMCYILYGGFKYGALGFMHCYYRFHMELGIGFRVYERKNDLRKFQICEKHARMRTAITH